MQNPNKYIEAPSEVINSLIYLFGKRKFNEIIQKIDTSIKKYPDSTTLLNIRGSSNLELKKLYSSSKISIIPLKETIQPSGQSVSLQSLSTGLPIIITETHGNWFFGEEIDSKFLNVVKKNEINLWDKKIRNLLKDNKFYENKSEEIEIFVSENLDKKKFDTALESLIFDEVSQN